MVAAQDAYMSFVRFTVLSPCADCAVLLRYSSAENAERNLLKLVNVLAFWAFNCAGRR